MASMPATVLHPSGDYFCGQSLNNMIDVYSLKHFKVKKNRKKSFRGHDNAGYACAMSFSPNGRYLASGDGRGRAFVWDWKTAKIVRKWRAHENDEVCMSAAWHPLEPSKLATCGYDG